MSLRTVRLGALAYFLLYLLAVIWPGALLFRGAEPLILGLPNSLFWPILFILGGWLALHLLDRAEERERIRVDSGEAS